MTRRITAWLAVLTLATVLAACSSSPATTAPSSGGGTSTAPSTEPASTEPSVAPSATESAAPSSSEPSIAIPSFVLPNDDKGLEALLPDQLCGKASIKLSLSGARFASVQDPVFDATLSELGKTAADVSFAIAEPNPATSAGCKVSAAVLRIKGADPAKFRDLFIAAAKREENTTYTTGNVGGKDVHIGKTPGSDKETYAYFKGDALFFVTAPDAATATPALQVMP
jgi:hypothetical protein